MQRLSFLSHLFQHVICTAGMANFEICGCELFKANWAVFRTVVGYDFVAFSPVVYTPGCPCGKLFAFDGKLNYG